MENRLAPSATVDRQAAGRSHPGRATKVQPRLVLLSAALGLAVLAGCAPAHLQHNRRLALGEVSATAAAELALGASATATVGLGVGELSVGGTAGLLYGFGVGAGGRAYLGPVNLSGRAGYAWYPGDPERGWAWEARITSRSDRRQPWYGGLRAGAMFLGGPEGEARYLGAVVGYERWGDRLGWQVEAGFTPFNGFFESVRDFLGPGVAAPFLLHVGAAIHFEVVPPPGAPKQPTGTR